MYRPRVFTVIVFILFSAALYAQDAELADLYVRNAKERIEKNDYDKARSLVEKALSFSSENSDALYAKGFLIENNYPIPAETSVSEYEGKVRGALKAYQNALREKSFTLYKADTVRYKAAELLYRLGNYNDALRYLDNINQSPLSTDQFYLKGKLFARIGKRRQLSKLINTAMTRYPKDFRFIALGVNEKILPRTVVAAYVDQAEITGSEDMAAALAFAITHNMAKISRERMFSRYFRLNGKNSEIYRRYIYFLEDIEERKTAAENYINGFSRLSRSSVLALFYRFSQTDLYPYLISLFSEFSGTLTEDWNNDGYAESEITYKAGKPTRFVIDKDQDAILDYIVSFKNEEIHGKSIPEKVQLNYGRCRYEIFYDVYPAVKKVIYFDAEKRIEYDTIYNRLKADCIDLMENPQRINNNLGQTGENMFIPVIPVQFLYYRIKPNEENLLRTSNVITEYNRNDGAPNARFLVTDGFITHEYRNLDKNGNYDYVLEYKNNLPVSGKRRITSEEKWQVFEQYINGLLKDIKTDMDTDGIYEYREIHMPTEKGAEIRMVWDYNDNGIPDSEEIRFSDGRTIRKFLNGATEKAPVEMIFKNEKLISVNRSGKRLQVVEGPKNVHWIGKVSAKADTLPNNLGEGIYEADNEKIQVFRIYDTIYAEVLE